jgi:hypothetical protein
LKTSVYLSVIFDYYRPDGVGTVTHEEKEKFQDIKERLRVLLENQITNFRFVSYFLINLRTSHGAIHSANK